MAVDPLPLDFGSDKPFYVYLYRDPRPGKRKQPIYVGKGTVRYGRADDHWLRRTTNRFLASLLIKIKRAGLSPVVEIVGWFDDELAALECERRLIQKFGRRVVGSGSLTNFVEGGKGTSGWVVPQWIIEDRRSRLLTLWQNEEYRRRMIAMLRQLNSPENRAAAANRMRLQRRDPAFVAALDAAMAKRWSDPAIKRFYSERMNERWANPDFRAAVSQGQQRYWSDPENRAIHSQLLSARLETMSTASQAPEAKARHRAGLKAYWSDPNARAAAGKRTSALWQRERDKMLAAARKVAADPDYRRRMSEISRAAWTPERRERQSEILRAVRGTREARARNSEVAKARWADPEYRARQSAIHRAHYAHPAAREKMAEAVKRANTPEVRAKKSASHIGRKLSDEHRAAIRAGHARRKEHKNAQAAASDTDKPSRG